jgi:hypothetical protein
MMWQRNTQICGSNKKKICSHLDRNFISNKIKFLIYEHIFEFGSQRKNINY